MTLRQGNLCTIFETNDDSANVPNQINHIRTYDKSKANFTGRHLAIPDRPVRWPYIGTDM